MPDISSFGKILMVMGALVLALGSLLFFSGHIPYLGKLPGDIRVEKENFHFYFPLTTCLLLSAFLSLALWVLSKLK